MVNAVERDAQARGRSVEEDGGTGVDAERSHRRQAGRQRLLNLSGHERNAPEHERVIAEPHRHHPAQPMGAVQAHVTGECREVRPRR